MSKTIKLRVLKKFTSPLTHRRIEIGEEFNAPANQFWFKRIREKDCEEIKKFSNKAKASEKKSDAKADKKKINGSK